jgi:hypothetical protein
MKIGFFWKRLVFSGKIAGLVFSALLPGLSFSACAGAAAAEAVIEQILGTSTEAPVFITCRAPSPTEIEFEFSRSVEVMSLYFDPPQEVDSISGGELVKVNFSEALKGGAKFTADLLVEDEEKNTLNVLIPFRARNNRLPPLAINEIRTETSKAKVEFVELKTLEAGNLGALRLFITGHDPHKPVFEFPPVEAAKDEYIVIHLRTPEAESLDEDGDDLALSGGTDASPTARDFWVPGSSKLIHKTDIIYLLDQDDQVVDGILMSETPDVWWAKSEFAEAAEMLASQGAWLPSGEGEVSGSPQTPGPADAVASKSGTNTRTICRDESIEDSNTRKDWYITATSSATPGKPNNSKRYVEPQTDPKTQKKKR